MSKFKVGDWWRTRDGGYEQIKDINADELPGYTIQTNVQSYTDEGLFISCMECNSDLIQKMKTPVWEEDND